MDEPVRRPRRRAALPPLLERVPQRPLDVLPGVRRPAARRQGRHGKGLGLYGRDVDEVGRSRAREGRPLREPGRRQPRRPDRPRRPAPPPRRVRRDRDARDRVEGEGPEGLRARRLRPRLLHVRPVVPADRRLRAEGPPPPDGSGLELPPVPRELRVLRGLGRLPRRDHASREVRRGLGGRARGREEGERKEDAHVRAEVHPQLRLHGRPAVRRRRGRLRPREGPPGRRGRAGVEGSRPLRDGSPRGLPQGRDPPVPPARPPRVRPPAHRGAEVGARVDGPLGLPVPVRADLDRRPARGRHGRDRHGVRDDLHDAYVQVPSRAGR